MRGSVLLSKGILCFMLFLHCDDALQNAETNSTLSGQSPEDRSSIIAEAHLEHLARAMAGLLEESLVCGRLKALMKAAENRENILDFREFLQETFGGVTAAQKLSASAVFRKGSHDRGTGGATTAERCLAAVPGKIDLYFPLRKHRRRWLKNAETALVAYAPLTADDRQWKVITAYAADGTKRLLDAQQPPQEAVLVLSRCEHGGVHKVENETVQRCPPHCGGGGGGGGSSGPYWLIKVSDFYLKDDHEPWAAGDPEIYVKVRHPHNSSAGWRRTDFSDVNDEKRYSESDYWWLPRVIYREPRSSNRYEPAYDTDVEVWEDDGGLTFGDDKLETIWWFAAAGTYQSDFMHLASYGYEGRDWYIGVNGDADLRLYVELSD